MEEEIDQTKLPEFMRDKEPSIENSSQSKRPLSPQQKEQVKQHQGNRPGNEPLIATQSGLQAHKAEVSKRLSQTGRRFFDLIEFDENEQLILEVRKHPFGLLVIWTLGVIVSLVLLTVPIVLAAFIGSSGSVVGASDVRSIQALLFFIGIVLAVGGMGVTFINTMLYKNNVIFVTSEKLAQVIYTSLFNRKISQLSIGDLQDVTVKQNGIFPRAFNYGTLTIETAGEQSNLVFNYVPAPYDSSKLIVGAHEANLHKYGN